MRKMGTAVRNSNLLRLTHEVKKEDGSIIKKEIVVRNTSKVLLWVLAICGILFFIGFTILKINLNIFFTH